MILPQWIRASLTVREPFRGVQRNSRPRCHHPVARPLLLALWCDAGCPVRVSIRGWVVGEAGLVGTVGRHHEYLVVAVSIGGEVQAVPYHCRRNFVGIVVGRCCKCTQFPRPGPSITSRHPENHLDQPVSLGNSMLSVTKMLLTSTRSSSPQPWVEHISECVAQHVPGEHHYG